VLKTEASANQSRIKMQTMLDSKIGIIAGNGTLPKQLVNSLTARDIKTYVSALNGITAEDISTYATTTEWFRVAAAGKIINFFKENNIKQIVLVGGMKRPSLGSLIPDAGGIKLIKKLRKYNDSGDNRLFDAIIEFLEENDLHVIGVDEAVPELLTTQGILGNVKPSTNNKKDIEYGKYIATEIGRLDIGQAAIVQNGVTLGVEGFEGTDELLTRCGGLQFDGHGAVLVKIKKPKQDRRIDLPSIGPKTIERLHKYHYKGVALEAGSSLILEVEETLELADKLGIFIYGI